MLANDPLECSTGNTSTDWERWARSWALLMPKLREGRARASGRVPRSFCMTCHRTLAGFGLIQAHKVLGHDVDVPQARQSTIEGATK